MLFMDWDQKITKAYLLFMDWDQKITKAYISDQRQDVIIGPKSDHCLPLAITNRVTHSLLFSRFNALELCQLLDDVTTATSSCSQLLKAFQQPRQIPQNKTHWTEPTRTKRLASLIQLVKVRRGKLVLSLRSIRFSWNFNQIIRSTKYK